MAHHSSYYIDDSVAPAPMLISSGFTDDLFPAHESARFYNRTLTTYPDADIALTFADFGHPRGQNQSASTQYIGAARTRGSPTTCRARARSPSRASTRSRRHAAARLPARITATTLATLAPGELRQTGVGTKTISTPAWRSTLTSALRPASTRARPSARATARVARSTGWTRLPPPATRCSARRQ